MHRNTVFAWGWIIGIGAMPACIATQNWDFESTGGAGGLAETSSSSVSAANAGGSGGGASSSGQGGAGGSACPGCTYGVRYGDDQEQLLFDMALANDGSLFFTGHYNGEMRLDAANALQDSVPSNSQPFLGKLDRMGKPLWITNPLDFKTSAGNGGSLSIAGGMIAWAGTVINGPSEDTFVELRGLSGDANTTLWEKSYGSPANDALRSSALSPDGKTLYLAGAVVGNETSFSNCAAFLGFNTNGQQNIVLLAIDATNGNCLWGKTWTGGNHLSGSISVVTGSDGTPFISGHLVSGTISNGQGFTFPAVPTVQSPKYGAVGFVLKLDRQTGDIVAAKGYANAQLVGMAADHSTGTIMAAGGMGANIVFKGNTLPGATDVTDGSDNLMLGFDENLDEKWASITGGPKNQFCPVIHSDGAGRTYAACLTNDKLDRGAVINCSTDRLCSVLIPYDSATGNIISTGIKTFGETQPSLNMGKTFVAAATPSALAVGGTWTVGVRFWDDVLLDVTGSSGDYDIGIGKVEPIP